MRQSFRQQFHANRLALTILGVSLSASILQAQEIKTWPSTFKPSTPARIITVQKGGDGKPYIYHTKHFELRSLTALNQRNMQLFATAAESVPTVLERLPMPLLGMPVVNRAKILIYPDEDSFVAGGGVIGAAGFYSGKMKAILLRADTFLTPERRAGSRLAPKADYHLLVHEFTHLCMHRDLAYLPTWFVEGTAEYLAAMYENRGTYQFSNPSSSIRKRIKQCLPNDKDEIVIPGIAETMALDSKKWIAKIEKGSPEDFYRSYATSLLIVHTLFHGGEKRREATRKFLHARKKRPPEKGSESILIPLEERKILQQRIIKYWRPRGLRLKFSST